MDRRDSIGALLAALIASQAGIPATTRAQARVRRIVALTTYSETSIGEPFQAFRDGLKALGYEAGRTIAFDAWFGDFSRERTAQLAARAVSGKPDVIFAQHGAILAVAALTRSISIVATTTFCQSLIAPAVRPNRRAIVRS